MPPHRFALIVAGENHRAEDFAADVRAGLTASPKHLACRYFYDAQGSRLFEAICRLPEYYLTRAETAVLRRRAPEIAALFPGEVSLLELGSGSAHKTRILLDALLATPQAPAPPLANAPSPAPPLAKGGLGGVGPPPRSVRYTGVDISPAALQESCAALARDYPDVQVAGIVGEYHDGLRHLRIDRGTRPGANARATLVLWLGSNIGNLHRDEAARFLARIRETMTALHRMLVGIDLRKDRAVLERAYDDDAGVTARFNKNLLARINRDLGGRFDLAAFDHRAVYDEASGRVEMYLVSTRPQRVRIDRLDLAVDFAPGEAIHTENSYKYSPAEIESLAAAAGLRVERQWFDSDRLFSVNLFASRG